MTGTAPKQKQGQRANAGIRQPQGAYTEYRQRTDGMPRNGYANKQSVRHMVEPNSRNLPQTAPVRQMTRDEAISRSRSAERRRREALQRQEEARRLTLETQKRASAAAKRAARKARKAQADLYRELRNLNTIKTDSRYTFPLAIIMTALAFTMLILAIVTTSVQISEVTTENSMLQRTYDSLVSDENKLRMELEVRDDLRTVENLAKNEYGMVKQDQVERYYLRTYNADKIELIEEEEVVEKESWTDKFTDALSAVGKRILSFFK